MLAEDGHPELAGEEPESKGIVRPARHTAVVVEVEAGWNARVRRCDEHVWVVDRRQRFVLGNAQIVVLEGGRQRVVRLEVELVDEQHLGADTLDDLRDCRRLEVPGSGQIT